jgi:hypothetical protein
VRWPLRLTWREQAEQAPLYVPIWTDLNASQVGLEEVRLRLQSLRDSFVAADESGWKHLVGDAYWSTTDALGVVTRLRAQLMRAAGPLEVVPPPAPLPELSTSLPDVVGAEATPVAEAPTHRLPEYLR